MTFALVIQGGLEKSGKACVSGCGMSYSLDVCGVCVCALTHTYVHTKMYTTGEGKK